MAKEKATVPTVAENNVQQLHESKNNFLQSNLISHVKGQEDLSSFDHLRITDTSDIPDLEPIIKLNGEIVAAKADLIVFSGGVKTGKSSVLDPFIATAITLDGKIIDPIPEIDQEQNVNKLAVVHIDTEQSKPKQKQKVNNILKRAEIKTCPDHFLSFNIKELDLDQYRTTTSSILRAANKKFGGVYMLFIDGIADYISDPNNTEESNSIVKYFEQIALEYNCPVFVIIHTNPNSDKERGNLGSQCIRKAASVLSVNIEDDITYLEPKYLRNAGRGKVPTLLFQYDYEKGYHVCCGLKLPTAKSSMSGKLQAAVNQIFAPPKALGYSEAIKEIMKYYDCSERTAKTRWKEIQDFDLIIQGPDKNWRKAI